MYIKVLARNGKELPARLFLRHKSLELVFHASLKLLHETTMCLCALAKGHVQQQQQ